MKRIASLIVSAALLLAPTAIVGICIVSCGGCAGKGQLNPMTAAYDTNAVADAAVVAAEALRESALAVFDAFMKVERENEAALKALNPDIHGVAEEVRKNGQEWLNDLTAAKVAYQSARTAENASQLNYALAAVRSALSSASRRLAEAATRKVTP